MTDSRNLRVTRLSSNAKGGFDFELGACTLIVGDNGWGKTGVKAALELAITGDSADFGKKGMFIMEMVAPVGQFWANALLSDGKALRFETTGSPSKASKPLWVVDGEPVGKSPAVILSDEVSLLMTKKADKTLRAALMDITVGDIDPASITEEVPEAFRKVWGAIWETALEENETVADAILAARKAIDKELTDIRTRKKADLGQRPDALDEAGLDVLRKKVWELQQKIELAKQNAATPGEVRGLVAPGMKVEGTEPVWYTDTPEMRKCAIALEGARASVKVLELMKDLGTEDNPVKCLTCRLGPVYGPYHLSGMIEEQSQRVEKLGALLTNLREVVRETAALAAAETPQITPPAPPAAPSGPDLGAAEAELQDGQAALGEALAARSAQEGWDQAALLKRRAEGEEKVYKALRSSVDAAIGAVLQTRVSSFEQTATAYLPEGERLRVALVGDKGKAICRVGMEGGKRPEFRTWRAMCGAERARAVGAIAGAWGRSREEPIRIGMLDEVWLGTKALMDTCVGMRHAVYEGGLTQAIVFAVRADETPEGWTRVDLT